MSVTKGVGARIAQERRLKAAAEARGVGTTLLMEATMNKEFGRYLRALREERGISARSFARQIAMDASNFSKIERGEIAPPSDEILARFANALGIDMLDDRWDMLRFHAYASRGEVPSELLEEEGAVELLPALFAHIRKEGAKSLADMFDNYRDVALGRDSNDRQDR